MSMSNQDLTRRTPRHSVPLSDAMNQLLRGAFTSPFGFTAATTLAAEMNLYETNDAYILQVPVPGAKPDQLSITVRENVVTIQGTTEIPAPEGARPIYIGTSQAQIREQIQLPGDVNVDQGVATYDNGVLTLTLPKAPSARERAIPMRIGTSGQMGQGQQQQQQQQQGQDQMQTH
jgi:HSP20 family protein